MESQPKTIKEYQHALDLLGVEYNGIKLKADYKQLYEESITNISLEDIVWSGDENKLNTFLSNPEKIDTISRNDVRAALNKAVFPRTSRTLPILLSNSTIRALLTNKLLDNIITQISRSSLAVELMSLSQIDPTDRRLLDRMLLFNQKSLRAFLVSEVGRTLDNVTLDEYKDKLRTTEERKIVFNI